MSGRGIKKWAPFQGLEDQEQTLLRVKRKHEALPEPTLSDDQEAEIDQALQTCLNRKMKVVYYRDNLKNEIGIVTRIDRLEQTLTVNGKNIFFKEIKGLTEDGE